MTWFRPVWPFADNMRPEPWHIYAPSTDPYEERARCGANWPKGLNHGYFETASKPTTERVCVNCQALIDEARR